MRVLVTGANAYGRAIAARLVAAGHHVRLFGGDADAVRGLPTSPGSLAWYAGDVATGGSIEPALSERQALVHAAALDEPAKAKAANVARILRGAKYARFAAEREQVDDFVVVVPDAPRQFAAEHAAAEAEAKLTRGTINTAIVRAGADADAVADEVARVLGKLPELGKQPGRETDAVTP